MLANTKIVCGGMFEPDPTPFGNDMFLTLITLIGSPPLFAVGIKVIGLTGIVAVLFSLISNIAVADKMIED